MNAWETVGEHVAARSDKIANPVFMDGVAKNAATGPLKNDRPPVGGGTGGRRLSETRLGGGCLASHAFLSLGGGCFGTRSYIPWSLDLVAAGDELNVAARNSKIGQLAI